MGIGQRAISAVVDGGRDIRAKSGLFFGLLALAALLMFTYGLARPPLKSLFAEIYGAESLPIAWIFVAISAVLAAGIYGRFAASVRVSRLFLIASSLTALGFIGLRIGLELGMKHAEFALYVLMETYIVVLVESFWSIANLSFNLKSARLAYGLFCAAGSIGAGAAEFFQRDLAAAIGTENILWLVAPVLLAAGWVCTRVTRTSDAITPPKRSRVGYGEGWRVVTSSRYLVLLLMIVACSQILINIVDYHLTDILETMYPGEAMRDQRTGVFGQVYFAINVAALTLQTCTGAILGALGLSVVFLVIPSIVTAVTATAWAMPRLATAAAAFVAAKTLDYSVFRATKELLYLPLSFREKTVGKAFVNMTTYRAAKAAASLLLLVLIPWGRGAVMATALIAGLTWLVLSVTVLPRYRAQARKSAADDD